MVLVSKKKLLRNTVEQQNKQFDSRISITDWNEASCLFSLILSFPISFHLFLFLSLIIFAIFDWLVLQALHDAECGNLENKI